jgi:hypothetical protein
MIFLKKIIIILLRDFLEKNMQLRIEISNLLFKEFIVYLQLISLFMKIRS